MNEVCRFFRIARLRQGLRICRISVQRKPERLDSTRTATTAAVMVRDGRTIARLARKGSPPEVDLRLHYSTLILCETERTNVGGWQESTLRRGPLSRHTKSRDQPYCPLLPSGLFPLLLARILRLQSRRRKPYGTPNSIVSLQFACHLSLSLSC